MHRRSRVARIGAVTVPTLTALAAAVLALAALSPPSLATHVAPLPTAEDHCYVEGMLMHHEQALDLSGLVLASDGVADRVRALAEFIVADQTAEIETMSAWSSAWAEAAASQGKDASITQTGHAEHGASAQTRVLVGCDRDVHASMSGMASATQIAALQAADGPAAQKLFLELMIVHHDGALTMARQALSEADNAFVRSSARHVIVEQSAEIDAMNALLLDAS